jgi:hypothetical protein
MLLVFSLVSNVVSFGLERFETAAGFVISTPRKALEAVGVVQKAGN